MVDSKKTNPLIFVVIGIVIFIFIGFALMSASSLFFANKINKTLKEKRVQYSGNSAEFETSDKLPEGFPKDFPVYPGAKVVSSVSNTQQGKGNGLLVTFTIPSGQGLNKVVPFYKNGLSTSGWTITSSFDSDIIQTWEIAKGNTEGSVSITSQRDGITIEVVFRDKK